jgi:hypothetical protein
MPPPLDDRESRISWPLEYFALRASGAFKGKTSPNRGRKIVVEFFLALASPWYIETGELREERRGLYLYMQCQPFEQTRARF